MLKLADLVVRGADEPLPKNTIHLPPTPMTEVPPLLPTQSSANIKIVPKATKPQIKIGSRKQSLVAPATPGPGSAQGTPRLRFAPLGAPSPSPSVAPEDAVSKKEPGFKEPLPPPSRSIPVPKKKAVPKTQAMGMNIQDVKACQNALKRLNTNKSAFLFLQPVDPVRDKAPE